MKTYAEFKPLVTKLASEKLQAEFIPNKDTKPGTLYGYYYIRHSHLGPVIAEFDDYCDDDGYHSDCIHIKVRQANADAYSFSDQPKKLFRQNDFKLGKAFIESLHTVPSKLSPYEGFMLSFHFLDSLKEQRKLNTHYLNTRVIYDTMDSMMRPGCNKKIYDINGGYIICGTFDNKEVEIIKLKNTTQRNKYDNLEEIVQITIPSIALTDKFKWNSSEQDNLVYNMAQQILGLPQQKIATDITGADLSRWDTAYHNMMTKIASKREKAN